MSWSERWLPWLVASCALASAAGAAELVGRVLDPAGQPIAGARIQAIYADPSLPTASIGGLATGRDGAFRVDVPLAEPVWLSARHPNFGTVWRQVDPAAGRLGLELRFPDRPTVSGRVLGPDGEPAVGAVVTLALPPESATTETAEDGTFRLIGETASRYQLTVQARGSLALHRLLDLGAGSAAGLELRLERGPAIVGTVSGPMPDAMAKVTIMARHATSELVDQATPDRAGRYRLELGAIGAWEVEARDAGSGRRAVAAVEVRLDAGEAARDFDLRPGSFTLAGQVLLGHDASACSVSVDGTEGSLRGQCAADGQYRLAGLAPGSYRVQVRCGLLWHEEPLALTADQNLRLDLERQTGRVVGRVLDAVSGRPVADAEARLATALGAGSTFATAISDRDGGFELPHAPAGKGRLVVEKEGLGRRVVEIEVPVKGTARADVSLPRDERVVLQTRYWTGTPVQQAAISIFAADGSPIGRGDGRFWPDGRLTVVVPPGEWWIELTARSAGGAAVNLPIKAPGGPYEVVVPPEAPLDLVLPDLAGTEREVKITLTDAEGRTPPRSLRARWWPFPVTGRYRCDLLPAGRWSVSVEDRAGKTWSGTVTTRAGAVTELVLQ